MSTLLNFVIKYLLIYQDGNRKHSKVNFGWKIRKNTKIVWKTQTKTRIMLIEKWAINKETNPTIYQKSTLLIIQFPYNQ